MYGPVINFVLCLFVPESPRWLYNRGRKEEARRVLAMFHSRDNDIHSPLIQLELLEMDDAAENVGKADKWWDLRILFANKSNSYRVGLAGMSEF